VSSDLLQQGKYALPASEASKHTPYLEVRDREHSLSGSRVEEQEEVGKQV
jgi:hypothetical protein